MSNLLGFILRVATLVYSFPLNENEHNGVEVENPTEEEGSVLLTSSLKIACFVKRSKKFNTKRS